MNELLINWLGDNLFYLVSFFAAVTAIIPLLVKPGQIFNRVFKWYNRIRWAGYSIIFSSLLGIYFNSLQNDYNDIKTEKKGTALKDSLRRDYNITVDTMQRKFIDGNKEIITAVINSLSKNGYKLDSTNKGLLQVIRDSAKTKVILPNYPLLVLCANDGIKKASSGSGYAYYKLNFCSLDAGSSDFKIKTEVLTSDSLMTNIYYIGENFPFSPEFRLPTTNAFSTSLRVDFGPDVKNDIIYLYIKGTYKGPNSQKVHFIDDVYSLNDKDNITTFLGGTKKEIIVNAVRAHYASAKK